MSSAKNIHPPKESDLAATTITATGRRCVSSLGHEVYLLGLQTSAGTIPTLVEGALPAGWSLRYNVNVGKLGQQHLALQGTLGDLRLCLSSPCKIAFLRHKWSGIVSIQCGTETFEYDLFSPDTDVILVHLPEGNWKWASIYDLHHTALLVNKNSNHHVPELRIQADATTFSSDEGRKSVGILRIDAVSPAFPCDTKCDLPSLCSSDVSWRPLEPVIIGETEWTGGIVSDIGGVISIPCDESGIVFLLTGPSGGLVHLSHGLRSLTLDLHAESCSFIRVPINDIPLASPKDRVQPPPENSLYRKSNAAISNFYTVLEQQLMAMDTRQPVALYVPRWHGVAASTKNLFTQTLAIPSSPSVHPSDLTAEQIHNYANALVSAGVRHVVISGGDIFNLEIVKVASRLASDFRADLLWHSNYLQMSEPHDWNLLRHWLAAAKDGLITNFGVVKQTLADWLSQLGIKSVFIPNIVPCDWSKVQATTITNSVGIWLSGSSTYRKLPHATLLAAAFLKGICIRGSGFDVQSSKMLSTLRLPVADISLTPISKQQMFKSMKKTGLSLYITSSECSPMLPLESFACGVPCLVGPSSHLFRRNPTLHEALVVSRPECPKEIADKIQEALGNQRQLLEAYISYYNEELSLARERVTSLVT